MKLAIEHETTYRYDAPVRSSTQYIRLTPRESTRQNVLQWQLDTPRPPTQTHDGYGNVLHVLTLDKPVREIRIRAHGVIETNPAAEEKADPAAALSPLVFVRCTTMTRPDEGLAAFAEKFRRKSVTVASLREVAAALVDRLDKAGDDTAEPLTAAQAFAGKHGSVRNLAHVFIACSRQLGIPARYVSGYSISHAEDDERIHGHAWAEAWVGERWRGFDLATAHDKGRAKDTEHLALAIGADYLDACPIRGVRTGGGVESMEAIAKLVVGQ